MFDMIIKNGWIVDGTGNPWFHADIGIEKGKIIEVGKLGAAKADKIIDAKKRMVSPGFIDIHSHSEWSLIKFPTGDSKVMQGVTLDVNGNCGIAPAPLREPCMGRSGVYQDWTSFKEYFKKLEKRGIGMNIIQLAGHGTLRAYAMNTPGMWGGEGRLVTDNELREMKNELVKAMEEGCWGMSSGLEFSHLRYLDNMDEMIELCKVLAEYNGFYATHQRERDIWYDKATEEAIETARRSGLNQVHLSHFVVRFPSEGKSVQLMWMVDEARKRGINVTCDVISPNYRDGYHWGAEQLANKLVPDWVLQEDTQKALEKIKDPKMQVKWKKEYEPDWKLFGVPAGGRFKKEYPEGIPPRWDRLILREAKASPELIGKTFEEIAEIKGKDPWYAALDIVIAEMEKTGSTYVGIYGATTAEWDSNYVMKHPTASISSDREVNGHSCNAYGAFPRIFRRQVRQQRLLTFEEAVHKMTYLPARTLGLKDRGMIREGMWADIVIFDPWTIADRATMENPRQYPKGIDYVIVNGTVVVDKGKLTGALPGKVLRKKLR